MTTQHNSDDIFEQFVHRAERRADDSMSIHEFRLALFALLGYVVIIGVLGVLVAFSRRRACGVYL
ncbi:MAG: hypothetical protein ACI915_004101 [Gammaproteobacteria bacterium]|jgi:hypothetical protein